jgi:hypothetical protein
VGETALKWPSSSAAHAAPNVKDNARESRTSSVPDNLGQWVEAVAVLWIGGWILFLAVWTVSTVFYGSYVLLACVKNPLEATVFGRLLGFGYFFLMAWICFPVCALIRLVSRVLNFRSGRFLDLA